MIKDFLFPKKEEQDYLLKKIETAEKEIEQINLYEIKLNKISSKLDSLIILSDKMKIQNETTNFAMVSQKKNLESINFLMQEQINIINKLSEDVHIYKSNLDNNIENFKYNKEKLLDIANFIQDIKKYISEVEHSSNNMKEKSDSILSISKTIKKISDDSKMLSINAQIEAAKISDKRTGFGVISDEMVRLSDNTRNNSVLIDNTIKIIINDIANLNKNIELNAQKIEESIVLCEVIVNFVEALNNEYKLNIDMFNRILDSMEEIISFIQRIKESIEKGYDISDEVFKNTTREYMTIDGFVEQSLSCKKDSDTPINSILAKNNIYSDEELKILMFFYRDYEYDPLCVQYEDETLICRNVYNTLFAENTLGIINPVLAKGWSDEGGKVWTIYLKDDVIFSNGEKITAEDVKFTIMRTFVKNPAVIPGMFENIKGYKIFNNEEEMLKEKANGIEILDSKTIKITLEREDLQFLNKLASEKVGIISKKEYLKNKRFIGTGAYFINKKIIKEKNEIILKLKANKYNRINYPCIKDVEILMTNKYTEYLEAYTKGEKSVDFDIIYPVPFMYQKKILKNNKDIKIDWGNAYGMLIVNFINKSKNKIVQDKNFRENVFKIIKNIDLAIEGNDDYYIKYDGISTYWYNNEVSVPKWLKKDTIIPKLSGEINIVTYESVITRFMSEQIKTELEKSGVKVNVHFDDFRGTLEKFDLSIAILYNDGYNLYAQLSEALAPPYGSYLLDTPIGEELQSLTAESNYKKQIELLKEMEIKILKEYYNLPIFYTKRYVLLKENIMNISDEPTIKFRIENLIKVTAKSDIKEK